MVLDHDEKIHFYENMLNHLLFDKILILFKLMLMYVLINLHVHTFDKGLFR
jgi:hypothetical protein